MTERQVVEKGNCTQQDKTILRLHCHYQLSLLTPGSSPLEANSRNAILDTPDNRYTPRPRPVSTHLFLIRVIEPLRGKLWSLCADSILVVAGIDRSLIVNLRPLLLNSCVLCNCLRLLSLFDWLVIVVAGFDYIFTFLVVDW